MRTTISIDLPLLRKIREIGHREHKPFTQVVKELLTLALGMREKRPVLPPSPFRSWPIRDMGKALIDYTDKEALYKILDEKP